jgi:iron(III) transport system substrate-binding protein
VGPNAVFKNAPNPNAARLFQAWSFTAEGQQVIIDSAGMHSMHPQTKEKPGRLPLSKIKLMKDDAAAVERETENIKKRYTQIFKV